MKILGSLMLLLLMSTAVGGAQTPPAASPPSQGQLVVAPGLSMVAARGPSLMLSLEAAQTAIDTCKALGANVAVSVVDSAGILKLMLASDGTFAKGVTTSTAKAITAKDLNMPISELAHRIKTDSVLADKIKSNPNYVVGQGGLPLRVGDEVIGAIGVGGATGNRTLDEAYPVVPSRDEICARAAVDKIRGQLK